MYPLVESVRIEDKRLQNIEYHNQRMNFARQKLFGCPDFIKLENIIETPQNIDNQVYKCRVEFLASILKIEIEAYTPKKIERLKLVYSDTIDYTYKSTDRGQLNLLLQQKGEADDIIIIKNGRITDSSFSNLAFFDGRNYFTPANPLLKGTCRQRLIDNGTIKEMKIQARDLRNFENVHLINAMLDLGTRLIPIENIEI
jgi:4-amino-4-deoxychorismate lyase